MINQFHKTQEVYILECMKHRILASTTTMSIFPQIKPFLFTTMQHILKRAPWLNDQLVWNIHAGHWVNKSEPNQYPKTQVALILTRLLISIVRTWDWWHFIGLGTHTKTLWRFHRNRVGHYTDPILIYMGMDSKYSCSTDDASTWSDHPSSWRCSSAICDRAESHLWNL